MKLNIYEVEHYNLGDGKGELYKAKFTITNGNTTHIFVASLRGRLEVRLGEFDSEFMVFPATEDGGISGIGLEQIQGVEFNEHTFRQLIRDFYEECEEDFVSVMRRGY